MPGIATNIPQFRYANNWLLQDAQTKIVGNHTFRYGAEFLWQLARQRPPFNERGSFNYTNGGGYTGLANFLDDFSGPSGSTNRNFGEPVYYPSLFRHSYFIQDSWRVSPALSLTLGLRYENFGQPANNAFDFPAFAGFDPAQFLAPNKVNPDNNNFGPSIGFAWTPSFKSGPLGFLFGDGKTVWRGGFQISYDTFFNNLLSNIAADTPNSVSTTFNAPGGETRGTSGFSSRLPATARPVAITDQQTAVFDKNIRSPYTERWSLGLQRELPSKLLLDVSYVGTAGHKLFTSSDVNPRLLSGQRLFPNFGVRRIRASEGNSIYHGLQMLVDRRFSQGFQITGAYTFSRAIDSTSEVFATNANPANTSIPTLQGGLALDRALADHHRSHRFTITYVWDVPGPRKGPLSYPFGGWRISGITTFQSGAPFSLANGFDRNNDGLANDRPDIGNPNAPINTRAVVAPTTGSNSCATGFRNPDALTLTCVTPNDVRWIEGRGLPNASTLGRNTLFTKWVNTFDVNILKTFRITESKTLEYRLETFNFFNHPQFTAIPGANVVSTLGPTAATGQPSRFLNPDFTNSGTRTMRMQLKFVF